MKRSKTGSTPRQRAYAMQTLSPKKKRSKKEIALSVGYSPAVADHTLQKIESTEGYANAMRDLAQETGNVVLDIFFALRNKDLSKEDFSKLVESAETMARVWEKFSIPMKIKDPETTNNLKVVFQNHAKDQTVQVTPPHVEETIKAEQ